MVAEFSDWKSLFNYPRGGKEGSLPFRFENFGTFAGPQFAAENYNYETAAKEGTWHVSIPGDYSFKNRDLGAYLFNNDANYVGFHCDGVSTAQMTLEASYGNIPTFNVLASTTNVNGNVNVTGNITAVGDITATGSLRQNGSLILSGVAGDVASFVNNLNATKLDKSNKGFDIQHPTKEGHRIRHICVEGPEDGPIYIRGKLEGNIIELPDYWDGLVDFESISVHLTPIGSYQELFFEKMEWNKRLIIKNSAGGPINCYYQVWAARKYNDKLQVVYEGETPADYPGDNSRFSIAGYDYDRREA